MTAETLAMEPDLLSRLRAGDNRAFEDLVQQNIGRMLTMARRFLSSEHDAADAVQDAFLSAFKALDRFEGIRWTPKTGPGGRLGCPGQKKGGGSWEASGRSIRHRSR